MAFDIKKTSAGQKSIEKSIQKANDIGIQKDFRYINVDKIIPSDKNFYSMENIDELADSIKEFGVLQPILVEQNNDTYKLISGHRRLKSSINAGLTTIPAYIKSGIEDIDFEILLIHANKQREKSDIDKAKEIRRLKELLEAKKGSGDIQGRIMDKVAEITDLSRSQAHRMDKLNELIPEFQELIQNKSLPASTAENFSNMDVETQKEIYDKIIAQGIQISRADAANIRKEYENRLNKTIHELNNEKALNKTVSDLLEEQKKSSVKDKETIENMKKELQSTKEQLNSMPQVKLSNDTDVTFQEKTLLEEKIEYLENKLREQDSSQPLEKSLQQVIVESIKRKTTIEQCIASLKTVSKQITQLTDGIKEDVHEDSSYIQELLLAASEVQETVLSLIK